MNRIRRTLLAAVVVLAAGCGTDTPEPSKSSGPSDAWLATCVEDWRTIYTEDGTPWPGDASMRFECRTEWQLRQSTGN